MVYDVSNANDFEAHLSGSNQRLLCDEQMTAAVKESELISPTMPCLIQFHLLKGS